jgi:hypothetical protein
MFRYVDKNLAYGCAEMAALDRVGIGVGIGQPVPLDVYRESHHLLALGGSIGMRGSIKQETWGRRGEQHLKMRMDFLDVSAPYFAAGFSFVLWREAPRGQHGGGGSRRLSIARS